MRYVPMATPDRVGTGLTGQRARDALVDWLASQGVSDPRVLDAMRRVPRHLFVEEALSARAYENCSLPIGCGQTISQPLVVARMTQAILAHAPRRVLEVGTGCGYQTAVLAEVIEQVYTVERIEELLRGARRRLRQMGYERIRSRHADGRLGWSEEAPYDAILVTAAGARLDESLFDQLADHGTLVAPVGVEQQRLLAYRLTPAGWAPRDLGPVSFVPLLDGVL
ncbi:MAG: protein-L-isoaspartate(D-aspartate) O-methyltransferase [Xanthomonadales bacterium]|nr:protein-L-isoaspartate(D-aspartate) O-methyltransferase [Xanthomonadales bacterium]